MKVASIAYVNDQNQQFVVADLAYQAIIADAIAPQFTEWPDQCLAYAAGVLCSGIGIHAKNEFPVIINFRKARLRHDGGYPAGKPYRT